MLLHATLYSIEQVLFYLSYRKIEKIYSLHDMVHQLCDRSEDFDLNENFFTDRFDQIRNKFKQVSDNLK